jgi:anti-sigma-K factor RskA
MSEHSDRDLLAAEYVLGSLEGEERGEAERLLASDPAFARSVADWQQRLTPLAAQVAPVAPPVDLWARIDRSITPAGNVVGFRRRVRFWQASTGVALAIAASLAAFIVLRQPEPARVAMLSPLAGGAPVMLATLERDALVVRPTGAVAVPSDKDLELWSLAQGETRPKSLGVLPASGRTVIASLAPNTQLLVSRRAGRRPASRPGLCCMEVTSPR